MSGDRPVGRTALARAKLGRTWLLVPLLAALCACILVLWSTSNHGIGIAPDSTVYLGAAENLLSGRGLQDRGQPLTHFPPGYSLALALAGLAAGGDVFAASRWLQALLFGANVALIWAAVYAGTGGSRTAAGAAMLAFVLSAEAFDGHVWLVSEPLFLAWTLLTHILLAVYLVRQGRRWLVAASLAAGLAITTRYIGAALLPPLLWILWKHDAKNRRLADMLMAVLIAGTPVTAWLVRNLFLSATATNRTLTLHPVTMAQVREFIHSSYWLALPQLALPFPAQILLVATATFLLLMLLLAWRRYGDADRPGSITALLPRLVLGFALTYAVFLIVSLSLFDASTNLSGRIVLPFFVALGVSGISVAWNLSRGMRRPAIAWVLLLFLMPIVLRNGQVTARSAVETRANGIGYSGRTWRSSPTLAATRSLAPTLRMYSNVAEGIEFATGRQTGFLPRRWDPTSLRPNRSLAVELQEMCQQCAGGQAVVVYLYYVPGRWHQGTLQ
jgi:hypothetical protein